MNILVKAGSRNETLETSGVNQYIKKLVLRVIKFFKISWIYYIHEFDREHKVKEIDQLTKKLQEKIEQELDNLGGQLDIDVGRETT